MAAAGRHFRLHFSHLYSNMRITVRFEAGLTPPLLSKARLLLPPSILQSEDLYEYLRSSFHLKPPFGLYLDGYYLAKRQKLRDIVREGCEVYAYSEEKRQKQRKTVCKFYIAMREPPFGITLVPTAAVSSTPVQH